MSRTRIVQGVYHKITGGDHNMSSEGKIISGAGNQVREMGTGQGVVYGNFERKGSTVNEDFEISFSLKKRQRLFNGSAVRDTGFRREL